MNNCSKPQEVRPGMVLFLPHLGKIPNSSVIWRTLRKEEAPWGHACIVLSITDGFAEIVMITSWRSASNGDLDVNEKWIPPALRRRYCHISHTNQSREWSARWPATLRCAAGQYHSIRMLGPTGEQVYFTRPGSYANIGVPYLVEAGVLEYERGTARGATIEEASIAFLSETSKTVLDAPGRMGIPFPEWKETFLRDGCAAEVQQKEYNELPLGRWNRQNWHKGADSYRPDRAGGVSDENRHRRRQPHYYCRPKYNAM